MAKVTYDPKPLGLPDRTSALGYSFEGGDAVDVPEGVALGKFRAWQEYHPELGFTVEEAAAKAAEPVGLRAAHRGRGVYGVFDGAELLDQLPGMTKADADAFNALSDEDKAAFVDKPADPATQPAPAT